MKKLLWLCVFTLCLSISSCGSLSVYADYEKSAPFSQYRTYAFSKSEIDKVEVSSLDKKRILNALEKKLNDKGFIKSDNPDLMISFFTKSTQRVDVMNNGGWGFGTNWGWGPSWGWGPGMGWGGTFVSTVSEGTLFINFVDTRKNELVWQGQGTGVLKQDPEKKEAIIIDFIEQILNQYPPEIKK
jgi:hypothetical protein